MNNVRRSVSYPAPSSPLRRHSLAPYCLPKNQPQHFCSIRSATLSRSSASVNSSGSNFSVASLTCRQLGTCSQRTPCPCASQPAATWSSSVDIRLQPCPSTAYHVYGLPASGGRHHRSQLPGRRLCHRPNHPCPRPSVISSVPTLIRRRPRTLTSPASIANNHARSAQNPSQLSSAKLARPVLSSNRPYRQISYSSESKSCPSASPPCRGGGGGGRRTMKYAQRWVPSQSRQACSGMRVHVPLRRSRRTSRGRRRKVVLLSGTLWSVYTR